MFLGTVRTGATLVVVPVPLVDPAFVEEVIRYPAGARTAWPVLRPPPTAADTVMRIATLLEPPSPRARQSPD